MSDVRESLRQAGDLIAATVDTEPLGGALDDILSPLARDIELAHDAWNSPRP